MLQVQIKSKLTLWKIKLLMRIQHNFNPDENWLGNNDFVVDNSFVSAKILKEKIQVLKKGFF